MEHPTPRQEPLLAPDAADRAAGLMAGLAYGDALGARYEGWGWRRRPSRIRFGRGILLWRAPGWWTDDTDMALGVLLTLALTRHVPWPAGTIALPTGPAIRQVPLDHDAALRMLTALWLHWRTHASMIDMGLGTVRVLRDIARLPDLNPTTVTATAQQHATRGGGGGNGAVMRTGPVALAFLNNPQSAYTAGATISALTHAQPRAGQAAGIWTVLCERAVITGRLHPDVALACVGEDPFWMKRLRSPGPPGKNGPKGWAPATLTDAWWCVQHATQAGTGLDGAVRAAVAAGGDTDTTAAIAGALTGALTGTPGLPTQARALVHGGDWTGRRWTITELAELAKACATNATTLPPLP